MLDRRVAGDVPAKHHIVHRDGDGALFWEHCLTRKGFDGAYTILYHQHRPHEWQAVGSAPRDAGTPETPEGLRRRHFRTQDVTGPGGTSLASRRVLLANDDVAIGFATPDVADAHYTSHADADTLVFVQHGTGTLRSVFGDLRYGPLDYVAVPKGVVHRFVPDAGVPQRHLVIEGHDLGLLRQWRNEVGQLRMDAPYGHRDFRRPDFAGPVDEGIRHVDVVRDATVHTFATRHNPLDAVGWDGTVYPWVFPMLAFQPRAGLVHLPPDWHGTFSVRGALICSFVPRVVDFHPSAIPCPYPHSSVDCDEVLFYVQGNFTSRKGVGPGSVSYHPYGVPHGPHPGALEASIGSTRTDEVAVMLDTFKPLRPTRHAASVEDPGYHDSFHA
ncbi:MAG: homogentisate 1,2-dioxygenase [Alphaproteobacteria bacterium]|nr:homogentisate 1,2-dioxygenase [Alphaproteobacteria bacterium]